MFHLGRLAAGCRARIAPLTLMLIGCLWLTALPSAHAATGEVGAFGTWAAPPSNDGDVLAAGPAAFDGDDLFVTDLMSVDQLHLRKFTEDGQQLASAEPTLTDPSGQRMYIVGLAVDSQLGRLYALVDADVPDGDGNTHQGTAREVLAYSTTPDCPAPPGACTLKAAADAGPLADGVLIDFRDETSSAVEFASGIAVDEETGKVAVLGVDDANAADPTGVIQYVDADGTPSTRVEGLGTGLDPDGAGVRNPAGLAIAPNGDVLVATGVPSAGALSPYGGPWDSESVFRRAREAQGASELIYTDNNVPQVYPGAFSLSDSIRLGAGSPIALSADGQTIYLAEYDLVTHDLRVRGVSPTGTLKVVYGGGTDTCSIPSSTAVGLAAGEGDRMAAVVMDLGNVGSRPLIHVFDDGGTGCPRAAGAFKVGGDGAPTVTVTKGQNAELDASTSDLLGGTATKVSWDYGDGTFVDLAQPNLVSTHKFLTPGIFQVGVKIEVDGAPATDPVYHSVTVVAPKPTASFTVSNRTPAAGGSVDFDAANSVDSAGPDGNPTHTLKEYHWDFGDGSAAQTTTGPKVSHTFANPAAAAVARTVKLTVVSQDDVSSNAAQQTVTVAGTPSTQPPPNDDNNTPPTQTTPTQTTPAPPPPPKPTPSTPSLTVTGVDAKGTLTLKVTCPSAAATAGKLDLTVKVKKKVKGKTKVTTVKVGSGSFALAAGQTKAIRIKLSSTGWSLLKKQKKLTVSAAIAVTGGAKTSKALTLKAPAKAKK